MKYFTLSRLPLALQLIIFLGCLLPLLWGLLAFDLHRIHRQVKSNSEIVTENLVRAFAEEIKSSVHAIDLSLISLRDDWLSRRENFSDAVQRHRNYLEQGVGFQVAIIDAAGKLAFSSADPQAKPVDLSDREHFRAHLEHAGDRLYISKPIIGRVSQRWSIQFTRPIHEADGRFAGVVVLSVAPDYFSRFYQSINLGEGGSIGLIRSTGEFLARSPNPEIAIGKRSDVSTVLQNRVVDHGLYEVRSAIDGVERLYAWRTLPKGDLAVVIGQSLDTVFAPYYRQRQVYIATGLGLSLLLAFIGYFLLWGLQQRARANAAFIENEARWKLALEAAGEGVWDWDIRKNEVQFSLRWKEILGFSENEVGSHVDEWSQRIHPDDAPRVTDELRAHLNGKAPTYLSEHRMRCRDGSWKWVLERGMVVSRSSNGKPTRMVGTFSDVTARKQSEAALQESMAQLSAEQLRMKIILENSYDAFVAVDSAGYITDWNNKAEAVFGWSAAEVVGKGLSEVIIPEEKRQAHNAGFRRFTATGKATIINTVVEVEAVNRDGRRIPVELAVAGFHDGTGYAANAFIRDISERKEAERRDIERTRSLEETRKALQHSQKLEALGRLTGGIAHDFNNVLQTLTTGLQVVTFSVKEQAVRSSLEVCQRAVERGVELTRQLSVFGRTQEAHLRTVDLADQITEMTPFLKGVLPTNIEFRADLAEGLWRTEIDPLQFELALLNLAMNARDAMPHGGCFTIKASNEALASPITDLLPGDYVHLVISDTGEGMNADLLAKALDPFFTTKPVGKGSGMGLPQAYGFARNMGGTLNLHSPKEGGLQVSMYLPRSTQEVNPPMPEPAPLSQTAVNGKVILFVEDDPLIRQTVQPALEASGFKVAAAHNGEEALDLLEKGRRIDLVFSDIVMPGKISGIDLADIVRTRFPQLKVVLATGYSERRVSSPDIRMLGKPYGIPELVNTLNEELSTPFDPHAAPALS
jgi:PAS domain S-box-containing protein